MKLTAIIAPLLTLCVASTASFATAAIVNFTNITNNGPTDVAGQLSADVTSPSAGTVLFKFANAGPTASFIGQIYFDDNNNRLSNMILNTSPETSAGVEFNVGAGNLPAGNSISPAFSSNIAADAKNPAPQNGVNPTEMLGIKFDGNLADVLGDISTGALRLGLHVQGIGTKGDSDSFVSVPEPSCVGVAALAIAMAFRMRSRHA